ncbi:hypothetical protein [Methylococcus capsulatus]|uniref:hypothetical protein n=1 Tax=Methylococcus capsulatus TaxID=414 RepID=UPI001C52F13E|nr:hypothetical protein [Methylococcus capsulatus]QXP90686.1 hypothetical protein KW114_00480 [Methylococcus capsulatus]
MRRNISLLLLVLFIVGLYVLQNKGVTPFVMKVLESDLFDMKEEEEEQLGKVKTPRTDFAYLHCKAAMLEDHVVPENSEFLDDKYEAWALGGRNYILRSEVLVDSSQGRIAQKFVCKLRMTGDDQANPDDWSILGTELNPADGGE